jgi:hypothetical protein
MIFILILRIQRIKTNRGIKGYTLNMKKLAPFMKVTLKITVKKVHKKVQELTKCDPSEWDGIPNDPS